MQARLLLRLFLIAFLVVIPSISQAVLQDEIQVYDDEINAKGEQSLELHLNNTPRGVKTPSYPGEVMNNNNTRITPEYAYGLGHDLEAGLYINSVVNNSTWNYAGAKVRMKWLPYHEEKGDPVFAGVNIELSNTLPQYEQSRYNSEARFILGKHIDEWLFVINPIFDQQLSQPYVHQGPDFNTAIRISREVAPDWSVGTEFYSNYNQIGSGPISYPNTQQLVFLKVYCDGGPLPFQAGIGKGFTNSSDTLTVMAILSIPLP
ncbi:hypothetical protein M2128_000802 [Polynucleobacter sphagniphilus]|jgi:hypothetical protein|uniref:Transporter n=2 Tax=Polynucleobacter sphagniphilus TaxID=1743169 RepID=A0AA43S4U3_9BURK|nr:hypothetical protein [Polynucleobacter sphagniphilus]MDF9787249.1 hypothetical protein [Polynucleobacter sphagniphilus]MDH6154381.1 hypothetical protein [Polynucleobacter sphagniphilus]MDH6240664.1 hypothetical protein [Polynucleobacter sphagniphilus]MDH6248053.1 hypothetical protein [Polynucleobacter sphagniphilus]MDH6300040.1 hypothetical protein [Polynucleobacter sphagniphilus]